MKKGFTLVELLAVIVILALLAAMFIPNTIKILKDNNLKIYKIKENELLKAAKDYAQYDKNFVPPTSSNPEKYVTMFQLVEGNYMNKILDTTSGNECNAFVKITLSGTNEYKYEACLLCQEYTSNKNFCNYEVYNDL